MTNPLGIGLVDVLLVSGLHANEVCASMMAEQVHQELKRRGVRVALVRIPRSLTLLALLDDPDGANSRYSQRTRERRLDMDLDGLDQVYQRRYPGALVFEFHNAPDSAAIMQIDPGKPVADYEVGTIGPHFVRPYEIGTWRNVDLQGHPTKFLIELPARYRTVESARFATRQARLQDWQAVGYHFEADWLPYLQDEADVPASRARGYLDPALAVKVADWIVLSLGNAAGNGPAQT